MVVQHNLTAMNTQRQLNITTGTQSKVTEQLSSGYKINRAADDAAGLTISEKMRSQIRGLTQASANAEDGVSAVQTAEGALAEVHDMLQRMNELAVKSANGTNTSADRIAIQKEVNALVSEINRVSQSSQFNTLNLLDGSFTGKTLQVGAANKTEQTIKISITAMNATGLGISKLKDPSLDKTSTDTLATQAGAKSAISLITKAIAKVSSQRSSLGAIQNRLEHTIKNLDNIVENTTAAESAIRDTDMASAMVKYSTQNILAQAGQSMLAQANQSTQGVLSLLG
ncbi:MAG: flagellin [Lachnospiraceae bacterium]